MKILYVITGLGLGGAERVTVDLADQMFQLGHEVKIAYLTGKAVVIPKNKEIEIVYLALNGFTDFLISSLNYRKLLKKFSPDVVHSHMVHANIFTRLNRVFSVNTYRLICTAHNSNEGGYMRMWAYRITNSLCDVFTNVSQEATEEFVKKKVACSDNIQTVYNGIDLEKFKNLSINKEVYLRKFNILSNERIIFSVGRFNEVKDYPNLINAVKLLKNKTSIPFKLLIAGDGELRSEIEEKISSERLEEDILLLGIRTDIPELMNLADIYVLSSKYEGLPTVLIEAMACGKFIVATDCGGSREILGGMGCLVPPKNSYALADALEEALNLSQENLAKNAIFARKRAEEYFSLTASVDKWLNLYEK